MTAIAQAVEPQVNSAPGCGAVLMERTVCPALNSLVFSGITAACAFTIAALEHGAAGGLDIGLLTFGRCTPVALSVAYAGPLVLDRLLPLFQRGAPVVEDEPPQPKGGLRAKPIVRNRGDPRPPANDGRRKMALLTQRLTAKRVPQPQAPRFSWDVVEFYDCLVTMWGKSLVRTSWKAHFPEDYTQLYRRYVGPRNVDLAAWDKAGLWKQWRIIEQVDGHGKCEWRDRVTLERALAMNDELEQYARVQGWQL